MWNLLQHVRSLPVVTWGLLLTIACVAPAADSPSRTAAEIDRLLESRVTDSTSQPVGLADDATFLRRTFLDLVGEPPTADDVLAFALDDSADKRSKLVDALLADEAFGENWARYWRDVILYRRTEERALFTRESLVRYLADQFNQGQSWAKIATSFMTATGDVRENGATALIMAQSGKPEDVTAEVSRIFLGIQIQCAQCHDHPTDTWKREQFHQLAAFFPRIAVRPDRSGDQQTFHVVVNDQPFQFQRGNNNNRFRGTPEHHMPDLEDPSAKGTLMQPVFFVTGSKLPMGTRDEDRRGTLANWITAPTNPWFAKAYVNRIWSELVGEGFYEPIDDLGVDRECSSPETLDHLAKGFTESGYDIKWLYRTIMATKAYQRKSLSRRDYEDAPFRANCPQRLRGDQLYDSLVSALDLETRIPPRTRAPAGQGIYGRGGDPRTVFNLAFGYDPSDPRGEVGGSIQQALAIMNAPFINQGINAARRDGLGALLRANPADQDALAELYLKVLARGPSAAEKQTCLAYIRQVGDRNEAFEDIAWSLINSTEFIHRN